MKRVVIWKSMYSPWVTTILYTISRDSPTLLLNLLNLHALKNKVSRFFTAEKAISKECRVKWLLLPALNQALCSHSRDSHREPPCSTYPSMRKTGADSRPFKAKRSRWRTEIFFFQTRTNPCGGALAAARPPEVRQSSDTASHNSSHPEPSCLWSLIAAPQPGLVLRCALSRKQQRWCSETADPGRGLGAFTCSPQSDQRSRGEAVEGRG